MVVSPSVSRPKNRESDLTSSEDDSGSSDIKSDSSLVRSERRYRGLSEASMSPKNRRQQCKQVKLNNSESDYKGQLAQQRPFLDSDYDNDSDTSQSESDSNLSDASQGSDVNSLCLKSHREGHHRMNQQNSGANSKSRGPSTSVTFQKKTSQINRNSDQIQQNQSSPQVSRPPSILSNSNQQTRAPSILSNQSIQRGTKSMIQQRPPSIIKTQGQQSAFGTPNLVNQQQPQSFQKRQTKSVMSQQTVFNNNNNMSNILNNMSDPLPNPNQHQMNFNPYQSQSQNSKSLHNISIRPLGQQTQQFSLPIMPMGTMGPTQYQNQNNLSMSAQISNRLADLQKQALQHQQMLINKRISVNTQQQQLTNLNQQQGKNQNFSNSNTQSHSDSLSQGNNSVEKSDNSAKKNNMINQNDTVATLNNANSLKSNSIVAPKNEALDKEIPSHSALSSNSTILNRNTETNRFGRLSDLNNLSESNTNSNTTSTVQTGNLSKSQSQTPTRSQSISIGPRPSTTGNTITNAQQNNQNISGPGATQPLPSTPSFGQTFNQKQSLLQSESQSPKKNSSRQSQYGSQGYRVQNQKRSSGQRSLIRPSLQQQNRIPRRSYGIGHGTDQNFQQNLTNTVQQSPQQQQYYPRFSQLQTPPIGHSPFNAIVDSDHSQTWTGSDHSALSTATTAVVGGGQQYQQYGPQGTMHQNSNFNAPGPGTYYNQNSPLLGPTAVTGPIDNSTMIGPGRSPNNINNNLTLTNGPGHLYNSNTYVNSILNQTILSCKIQRIQASYAGVICDIRDSALLSPQVKLAISAPLEELTTMMRMRSSNKQGFISLENQVLDPDLRNKSLFSRERLHRIREQLKSSIIDSTSRWVPEYMMPQAPNFLLMLLLIHADMPRGLDAALMHWTDRCTSMIQFMILFYVMFTFLFVVMLIWYIIPLCWNYIITRQLQGGDLFKSGSQSSSSSSYLHDVDSQMTPTQIALQDAQKSRGRPIDPRLASLDSTMTHSNVTTTSNSTSTDSSDSSSSSGFFSSSSNSTNYDTKSVQFRQELRQTMINLFWICGYLLSILFTIGWMISSFYAARDLQLRLNSTVRPLLNAGYRYLNVLSSIVKEETESTEAKYHQHRQTMMGVQNQQQFGDSQSLSERSSDRSGSRRRSRGSSSNQYQITNEYPNFNQIQQFQPGPGYHNESNNKSQTSNLTSDKGTPGRISRVSGKSNQSQRTVTWKSESDLTDNSSYIQQYSDHVVASINPNVVQQQAVNYDFADQSSSNQRKKQKVLKWLERKSQKKTQKSQTNLRNPQNVTSPQLPTSENPQSITGPLSLQDIIPERVNIQAAPYYVAGISVPQTQRKDHVTSNDLSNDNHLNVRDLDSSEMEAVNNKDQGQSQNQSNSESTNIEHLEPKLGQIESGQPVSTFNVNNNLISSNQNTTTVTSQSAVQSQQEQQFKLDSDDSQVPGLNNTNSNMVTFNSDPAIIRPIVVTSSTNTNSTHSTAQNDHNDTLIGSPVSIMRVSKNSNSNDIDQLSQAPPESPNSPNQDSDNKNNNNDLNQMDNLNLDLQGNTKAKVKKFKAINAKLKQKTTIKKTGKKFEMKDSSPESEVKDIKQTQQEGPSDDDIEQEESESATSPNTKSTVAKDGDKSNLVNKKKSPRGRSKKTQKAQESRLSPKSKKLITENDKKKRQQNSKQLKEQQSEQPSSPAQQDKQETVKVVDNATVAGKLKNKKDTANSKVQNLDSEGKDSSSTNITGKSQNDSIPNDDDDDNPYKIGRELPITKLPRFALKSLLYMGLVTLSQRKRTHAEIALERKLIQKEKDIHERQMLILQILQLQAMEKQVTAGLQAKAAQQIVQHYQSEMNLRAQQVQGQDHYDKNYNYRENNASRMIYQRQKLKEKLQKLQDKQKNNEQSRDTQIGASSESSTSTNINQNLKNQQNQQELQSDNDSQPQEEQAQQQQQKRKKSSPGRVSTVTAQTKYKRGKSQQATPTTVTISEDSGASKSRKSQIQPGDLLDSQKNQQQQSSESNSNSSTLQSPTVGNTQENDKFNDESDDQIDIARENLELDGVKALLRQPSQKSSNEPEPKTRSPQLDTDQQVHSDNSTSNNNQNLQLLHLQRSPSQQAIIQSQQSNVFAQQQPSNSFPVFPVNMQQNSIMMVPQQYNTPGYYQQQYGTIQPQAQQQYQQYLNQVQPSRQTYNYSQYQPNMVGPGPGMGFGNFGSPNNQNLPQYQPIILPHFARSSQTNTGYIPILQPGTGIGRGRGTTTVIYNINSNTSLNSSPLSRENLTQMDERNRLTGISHKNDIMNTFAKDEINLLSSMKQQLDDESNSMIIQSNTNFLQSTKTSVKTSVGEPGSGLLVSQQQQNLDQENFENDLNPESSHPLPTSDEPRASAAMAIQNQKEDQVYFKVAQYVDDPESLEQYDQCNLTSTKGQTITMTSEFESRLLMDTNKTFTGATGKFESNAILKGQDQAQQKRSQTETNKNDGIQNFNNPNQKLDRSNRTKQKELSQNSKSDSESMTKSKTGHYQTSESDSKSQQQQSTTGPDSLSKSQERKKVLKQKLQSLSNLLNISDRIATAFSYIGFRDLSNQLVIKEVVTDQIQDQDEESDLNQKILIDEGTVDNADQESDDDALPLDSESDLEDSDVEVADQYVENYTEQQLDEILESDSDDSDADHDQQQYPQSQSAAQAEFSSQYSEIRISGQSESQLEISEPVNEHSESTNITTNDKFNINIFTTQKQRLLEKYKKSESESNRPGRSLSKSKQKDYLLYDIAEKLEQRLENQRKELDRILAFDTDVNDTNSKSLVNDYYQQDSESIFDPETDDEIHDNDNDIDQSSTMARDGDIHGLDTSFTVYSSESDCEAEYEVNEEEQEIEEEEEEESDLDLDNNIIQKYASKSNNSGISKLNEGGHNHCQDDCFNEVWDFERGPPFFENQIGVTVKID